MMLVMLLGYSLKSFSSLRSLLRLGGEESDKVRLVSNSLNTVLSYHNNAYFTPRRVP